MVATETIAVAHVVLPLPIHRTLVYTIPPNIQPKIGHLVAVPLGNHLSLGVVVAFFTMQRTSSTLALKPLLAIMLSTPLVSAIQLSFIKWIAQYYMAPVGEVLQTALPFALKDKTKFFIQTKEKISEILKEKLTEGQKKWLSIMYDIGSIKNVSFLLKENKKSLVLSDIYSWIIRGQWILTHDVQKQWAWPTVNVVHLHAQYQTEKSLKGLCQALEKYPKQLAVLLQYFQHTATKTTDYTPEKYPFLDKKYLLKTGISPASLQTLIQKNVLVQKVVKPPPPKMPTKAPEIHLTPIQAKALESLERQYEQKKKIVLLHGITGSGKTEIYITLIQKVLKKNQQVLYLVPEIALTTQLVMRLRKYFGDQLGVYHSRATAKERAIVWQGLQKKYYPVIIGVRSSIFLPFQNLGLIIVDEEHEPSYKQQHGGVRYHARDSGTVLAQKHQSLVVLGSATPAIETFHAAQKQKYGYVALQSRYGNVKLPSIFLKNVQMYHQHVPHFIFAPDTLQVLAETLSKQRQSIVFQNRRGYAPYYQCRGCGWVAHCIQCDVSLTYHHHNQTLCCHYCGFQKYVIKKCMSCGENHWLLNHFGTEKIAIELQEKFPHARIARMDLDTTRKKNAYENIVQNFSEQKIDILVGTQMVTKGFDFSHVSLVCVLDIDRVLHWPDFRAHEQCFQRIVQVSGRAGRSKEGGKVLIQTLQPQHQVLQYVLQNDYWALYRQEIVERTRYLYPPLVRLVKIITKHPQKPQALQASKDLYHVLYMQWGDAVLYPQVAVVSKLKNHYCMDIWIKWDKKSQHTTDKLILRKIIQKVQGKQSPQVVYIVDVDPV